MTANQKQMLQQCSLIMDDALMDNVKIAQLVFEFPFLGLLLTKDDQVYLIGAVRPGFGLDGPPPDDEKPLLKRMDALCGKKVKQFAVGYDHILALTEDGTVYSWGCNSSGQLGDGTTTNRAFPEVVKGNLANETVVQIQCGSKFSAALTDDGHVYTWGTNSNYRTGHKPENSCTELPLEVNDFNLLSRRITYIACSRASVFCLTESGGLLAFGNNTYGELGIDSEEDKHQLALEVKIPDRHWIQEVRTSDNTTLALTNDGIVFGWGCNMFGQAGTGATETYENIRAPERITFNGDDDNSIMHIAMENDACYAVDINGFAFHWGSVPGKLNKILSPEQGGEDFPLDPNTLPRKSTVPSSANQLSNDMLQFFDTELTTDFVINVEGKDIRVHKSVLQIRSEYFRTMFSSNWKEAQVKRICVEEYSYAVYRAFLRYLYCGELPDLSLEQMIKLVDLAKYTLDERLEKLAEKHLKKAMEFGNVAKVFSLCLRSEKEGLSDYCVRFAMRGMRDVLESLAFAESPGNDMRELLKRSSEYGSYYVR